MENSTLSMLGLLILILLVKISYDQHHLFLDHITVVSFILGMAYIHKIMVPIYRERPIPYLLLQRYA
ncbi:hypothetical protein [uncultured Cyclobacterium sp.]|uniref:hypothetical protein n=1 Tax=uncultured Cyclobacterium sp. TaxID=453820 RepID=UPI0030EDBAD9